MRTATTAALLMVLVLTLVGCSGEGGPPAGFGVLDVPGGDLSGDAWVPPDLPSGMCGDHEDCEPGWCDPETLTCVVCLKDEHCPQGMACAGKECVPGPEGCQEDGDCPEGVCDVGTGECVECVGDGDCGEGFRCDERACVQLLCAPGELTCYEGMVLILCNTDGSGVAWEKSCSDNDPCTDGDGCLDGACLEPVARSCDDGNPCTDDSCGGPLGDCYHTFNDQPCDDGFDCTEDDHCQNGLCKGGAKVCECKSDTDCGIYDDGDLCNGSLLCGEEGYCVLDEDSVVECPDSPVFCKEFVCLPLSGACQLDNKAQGVPCQDDDPCTEDDWCEAGLCIGKPVSCSDGNPCTDELCVPGEGCVFTNNAKPCNDGKPCTWPDSCVGGVCWGPDFDCDDGNPCTADSCNPDTGCVNTSFTGPCDDGSACTEGDECLAGVCLGEPVVCQDGNFCTWDLCNPATGCTHPFNDLPCDDDNPCTEDDHCFEGACIPGMTLVDCDDGNPCTTDTCDAETGACFNLDNTFSCSDGNPCTVGDACLGGVCKPGVANTCNDGNPCTLDACLLANGTCSNTPIAGNCTDGNLCTVGDHCQAGVCVAAGEPDCYDGNPCTADGCVPEAGCVHPPLGAIACDDQNICTQGDKCQNGSCVSGATINCDDGNPCTGEYCDAVFGCQYQDLITGCDDGDPCSTKDQCQGGLCIGGSPLDCNDQDPCTQDWCEEGYGCKHANDDGAPCSDGDPCSFGDACLGGQCVSATGPVDCNDGNPCTQDQCGSSQCMHYSVPGLCDDGDPCTSADQCQGGTCGGTEITNCGCRSLKLDGAGDCVTTRAHAALSPVGAFTLEAWIRPQQGADGVVAALDRGPGSTGRAWRASMTGGLFVFQLFGTGAAQVSAGLDPAGAWQHVAVVHTGAALQLWVGGTQASSAPSAAAMPAVDDAPLSLGCAWDPATLAWSGFWEGWLDEIRLSAGALYTVAFAPPPALDPGPGTLALWSLDQVQGNAAFDTAGWQHHGYIAGNPQWSTTTPEGGVCAPVPNYPPTTPTVSVVPDLPVDSDTLQCQVVGSVTDPDSDSVTFAFAWLKGGVLQPAFTSATLPASATSGCPPWNCPGCETWTCQVTASDPQHPGLPGSDAVTVGLDGCLPCDGSIFGQNCYRYFAGQYTWNGAHNTCTNWIPDGHLATITSSQENSSVRTLAAAAAWIGGSDTGVEGVWAWVTGEPWGWTGWANPAPDNAGNEDCLTLLPSGGWNDRSCANAGTVNPVMGFICEADWTP